jgi:anti-sigma-K factor RskA
VTGDLHLAVGAYVVDALDDDERLRFEAHLSGCAACTTEVAEFRATAGRLATLTVEPAPPSLRQSVLDGAAATRQASPLRVRPARRRRPVARWVAPALLVAAVVAVAVLAVDLWGSHRTLDRQQELTAVLTAPDARTVPLSGRGAGRLRLVYSPSRQQSAVVADGLADVAADRAYAMWFIGPDGPALAGLFRSADGRAATVMDGTPTAGQDLGVTVEPSGGSAAPTSPILYAGAVG